METRWRNRIIGLFILFILFLIARSWWVNKANADLIADLQSADKARRLDAAKRLLHRDNAAELILAQPMVIEEDKELYRLYKRREVVKADASVRKACTRAIAEAAEIPELRPVVIKTLIELMKGVEREATDPSSMVRDEEKAAREVAWKALGKIGEPAIPDLILALKDPSGPIRDGAVEALGIIGLPCLPQVLAVLPDRDYRGKAGDTLVRIGKPSVPYVIPLLNLRIPDQEDFPVFIADLLGRLDDPRAVPELIAHLDDPIPGLRRQILRTLTGIADPQATMAVLRILKEDPQVKAECISALGEFRDPRAVDALADLFTDLDRDIPNAAVGALQKIGKPAIPRLLKDAKSANPVVRRYAIACMATIGGSETVEPILTAIRDPDSKVREQAVLGSAKFRGSDAIRAIPLLLERLKDDKEQAKVAQSAVTALTDIATLAVTPSASENPQPQVAQAVMQPLIAFFGDTRQPKERYYRLVYYASKILSQIGQPAVPALTSALRRGNAEIRKWCALTLGDIQDRSAVQPAVPLLQQLAKSGDPELRWAARDTLRKLGIGA